MLWFPWQFIFVALSCFAIGTLLVIFFLLPEVHRPDKGISLLPRDMAATFWRILTQPQFCTYAFAGAFSFAGLFAYVAGSPIIFMDGFHVSEKTFGIIFAVLTLGFIGGSQVNVFLLRRLTSQRIFSVALTVQVLAGLVFITGTRLGWYGMGATLVMFFLFLSCIGLTYPNAAAIALAPFSRNAGSASALLGFIQMGTGAAISTGIGFLGSGAVVALLAGSSLLAAVIFIFGKRSIVSLITASDGDSVFVAH
jgi:DHA1 family bicyclomycin/chloramphenicol resistance-like MFS transporter